MLTINAHTDAESWWVAQDEEAAADRHELLTVGGQTGEFAARHIVPLSKALDAARAFFDSGEAAEGITGIATPDALAWRLSACASAHG